MTFGGKSYTIVGVFMLLLLGCAEPDLPPKTEVIPNAEPVNVSSDVFLVVLGTVQDAGSPQIGCKKDCCKELFEHPDPNRMVISLGLVDRIKQETYLFEATPDLPTQLNVLNRHAEADLAKIPNGVFLTHAHIGHYTGLMYFGKEAMNAAEVPVYAMPRMSSFLETNGPWSQLVINKNIRLNLLENRTSISLNEHLSVQPILVPHRDEFSETVGFIITGPHKKALFIPDIDKWNKWDGDITAWIKMVDYAFLDATFYDSEELNNRDMSEIPHPFVVESMDLFKNLSAADKAKVYFIHFNHTNPLLDAESKHTEAVEAAGFKVAQIDMELAL